MQRLVQLLKDKGFLSSPRIEEVMLRVDRKNYCLSNSKTPYADNPESIGFGATISAPHMHAYALEALKDHLIDDIKVLDVGSGSGYLTACIAHLIGPNGVVYGVEHVRDLIKLSTENIRKDCPNLLESKRLMIVEADGRDGLPDYAPYDVIHVGAASTGIPEKLVEQLKVGGLMVIPVSRENQQTFECVEKLQDGQICSKKLLKVIYVPLTDVNSQLARAIPS